MQIKNYKLEYQNLFRGAYKSSPGYEWHEWRTRSGQKNFEYCREKSQNCEKKGNDMHAKLGEERRYFKVRLHSVFKLEYGIVNNR